MTEGPPEIDNLYLDMNGIIHNCTHANRKEVDGSEDDMMLKVFDYLDKLIQIIRPQKVLFMAIDGEGQKERARGVGGRGGARRPGCWHTRVHQHVGRSSGSSGSVKRGGGRGEA